MTKPSPPRRGEGGGEGSISKDLMLLDEFIYWGFKLEKRNTEVKDAVL
jgi:hypothetical protein